MSNEHKLYLKKLKKQKHVVLFFKIFIIILFLGLWEVCARVGILNSFLTSYPSKIFITISDLFKENNLLSHIWVTLYETVISFSLASIIGIAGKLVAVNK